MLLVFESVVKFVRFEWFVFSSEQDYLISKRDLLFVFNQCLHKKIDLGTAIKVDQ